MTNIKLKEQPSEINPYDCPYEEELARYPFSLRTWLRYIDHKQNGTFSFEDVCNIYDRALKELPGSYKLWKQYLDLRRDKLKGSLRTCSCPSQ
ncbi:unnamed protein product [Absidia cylindrospora]